MASGNFSSSLCTAAGAGFYRYIEVVWSSSNDTANNKSTINWTAYSRSPDASMTNFVGARQVIITINGQEFNLSGSDTIALYKDKSIGTGFVNVTHGDDGTKTVNVSISAQIYSFGTPNSTYSGTITMTRNPVYSLNIYAGSNSSITVNRTYCAGIGSTGNLTSVSKLCKGDILKITFSASPGHTIYTHTVNGTSFTSGSAHTVSGDVSVVSTTSANASTASATDANIGSASNIVIVKADPSYTHTIGYQFKSLSGTIVTKTSQTVISWTVPTSFYAQITNFKSAKCNLTITTYNGNQAVGSNTFSMTVNVSDDSAPIVTGTVIDENSNTVALTGDNTKFIRFKSTALCTLTATPQNYASISTQSINGADVSGSTSDEGVVTATKSFVNATGLAYKFSAKDSRGFVSSEVVNISDKMIDYLQLTFYPEISRPNPTDGNIYISFNGNYFNGSFGEFSNTLTIRYRYKTASASTFGSWNTISPSSYTISENTFRTSTPVLLGSTFGYQDAYVFEINAYDGANSIKLSDITVYLNVKKGIPVFDWGENDFTFHVPIKIGNTVLTEEQLVRLLALLH